MADRKDIYIIGEVVDESGRYSLRELCDLCGVPADYVIELVEYGVIEPEGGEQREWRFSGQTLIRSRRARRLQRDLDLNLPGIALSLDLLEELEGLRQEVEALRRRLELERFGG